MTVTFQGEKAVAAVSWRQRKTTRWLAKKSNVVVQKLPAKDFTCGLCLDALPCHPAFFVSGALFQRDLPGGKGCRCRVLVISQVALIYLLHLRYHGDEIRYCSL